MRTIKCNFTFEDGAAATAVVEVSGPEDFNPVRFDGAVDRLVDRPERASSVGIRLWAEDTAEELGCQLSVDESGEFDAWAE